ncbi:MAG: phytase [Pseudohongiella sp.]|nr:phytase [Pseudohongiella sp.]
MTRRVFIILLFSSISLAACVVESTVPPPATAKPITATVETEAVQSLDDAADDPAIWVNEADIELSRVIGTDKNFGIEVYSLAGEKLQSIAAGRTNNVDLRMLEGNGRWSALAAASNRSNNTISLFLIDRQGTLTWLQDSEIATGLTEPYGLCMFANAAGLQVFVNDTDGRYQQWLLDISSVDAREPAISAMLVREFAVPSQPEGCVADDEHQRLFVGVENEGVRWLSAHHRASARLWAIADIDGDVLVADVEGMSLYHAGSKGYLVVSGQGNNSYAFYNRLPPFDYRGSVFVVEDTSTGIDGTSDTDGLDVSSSVRTPEYPQGLLVVQDGSNTGPREPQNFKYLSWEKIASALGL